MQEFYLVIDFEKHSVSPPIKTAKAVEAYLIPMRPNGGGGAAVVHINSGTIGGDHGAWVERTYFPKVHPASVGWDE